MVEGTQFMEPPAAQFYKHRIGAVELIALSDGGLNYPTAMILDNVPPEGVAQYRLPEKQLFIEYTILLVKAGDKLVLNDVGAGDLGNPGDGIFPGLDHTTSRTNLVVDPLFVEHPEWAPAIDMDAGRADETRRRFFAQAAEENALVFAHHLGPFPNLGRIVKKGDSWQWEPIEAEGETNEDRSATS